MVHPTPARGPAVGLATWIGLGLLAGLALVARLHGLDDKSLWGDEMNMVRFASGERPAALSFGNAPLYVALLRAVSRLATTDFAYRLPAALFGAAIVPAVFLLGRRVADWRVGAVAGVLAALSPFLVEHSQSVHSYSAFCLFSVLAHHLLARAWDGDSKADWACLVLTVGVGLYVHLYMVFVAVNLVALVGVQAARDGEEFGWRTLRAALRRRRRSLLMVTLAIAAIWSPWVVRWIGPLLWDLVRRSLDLVPTVDYFAQEPRLQLGWGFWSTAARALLTGDVRNTGPAVGGLLVAAVGVVAVWRRRPEQAAGIVAWVVLPLVPTAAFSYLTRIDYGTRRLIFLLPELLLLVAAGFVALADALGSGMRASRRRQLVALALAVVAAVVATGRPLAAYFERENADYRRLAAFLAAQVRRGDTLMAWNPDLLGYYWNGSHEILDVEPLTLEQLERLAATSRRLWYVRPRAVRVSRSGGPAQLETWLAADRAFTFPFGGGLEVSYGRPGRKLALRERRERVRLLEDALRLKPDRWYLHGALARAYRGLPGQDSLARYYAEEAARLRP